MKTPSVPKSSPKIPWLKLARRAVYRAAALACVPGWKMHPRTVRRHIRKEFGALLRNEVFAQSVTGHLGPRAGAGRVQRVLQILQEIAG